MTEAEHEEGQEPAESPFQPPETAPTPEEEEEGEQAERLAEPGEGEGEEEGEPSEPGGLDQADEQPQPRGLTEKELEARFDKLNRENERHAARVGQILEEDANDLLLCPLCSPFIHGFILNAPLADEPLKATLGFLGVVDTSELPQADYLEACATCEARGEIRTGSHRPGYEAANCEACQGTGYRRVAAVASNGHVMAPDYLAPHENVVPPPPADLAEVERLRLAGYTVVPPMHVAPQP